MKTIKTKLSDVLNDDLNNPFWQRIQSTPQYAAYEQEVKRIMHISMQHGKPYVDIDKQD